MATGGVAAALLPASNSRNPLTINYLKTALLENPPLKKAFLFVSGTGIDFKSLFNPTSEVNLIKKVFFGGILKWI